jgi:hypothetical protein
MEDHRQNAYQRNPSLENLINELNEILGPVEEQIISHYNMPRYPVVLIIGLPRGGSTLLMQWLAYTSHFAYPTNIMSRFYKAPAIGAKIQRLLTDQQYNFKNELTDIEQRTPFTSDLGKTQGSLEPNEFWYFWRRFIPTVELRCLENNELDKVMDQQMLAELAAIEDVFNKPLLLKGLMLELNLPFFSNLFDNVIFLYVKRDPFYNIQSLLEARVKYYGTREKWYSIKPREYTDIMNLSPIDQVAGQVFYTLKGIDAGVRKLNPNRWLMVNYEQFCADPKRIFDRLLNRFSDQGYDFDWQYTGPDKFQHTNQVRLPESDVKKIILAYKKFSNETLVP